MKDIRLQRLTLDNFKGQPHFDLVLGGRDAAIYGDNAAGKTTIYDALNWLLFGKDSAGRGDFEIKPLGPDGTVLDHAAVTSVEAVLSVDGMERRLRKEYYEKWSSKRGSVDKTFDGNTCDYYIDRVPVKKYEFDDQVHELVDEDIFRALTSTGYFLSGMKWQDRRKALFNLCGVAPDEEILASVPDFAPLAAALCGRTVEQLKKALEAERRGYNTERETIPVRIDECKRTIEDLTGIDFDAIRAERDTRKEEVTRLKGELLALEHNTLRDQLDNELRAVAIDISALERENEAYMAAQLPQDRGKRERLIREKEKAEAALKKALRGRDAENDLVAQSEKEVENCRAKWKSVAGETFRGANCPTCGQPLPAEAMERAREEFEARKQKELDMLVQQSKRLKEIISQAKDRAEQDVNVAVEAENWLAEVKDELSSMDGQKAPVVTDKPGYAEAREALDRKRDELRARLEQISGETAGVRRATEEKIRDLEAEITAISSSIAQEATLERAQRRMEELRESARATAAKMEELDKLLDLCGQFARYKTGYIEESVNSRFRLVTWKLFSEQVNGGVAECCEAMVDGVPYGSLNNGAKVNAGLDVISALSRFHGVRVPLFVDNAESVTVMLPMDCQVIRLVVSGGDENLRVEVKAS